MSASSHTSPAPREERLAGGLPAEFSTRRLVKRLAQASALLAVVGLVALLAPGLDQVRDRLAGASPWWLALAVVFELLSCLSYVLMFRPIFCRRMSWRTSSEIAWAELGAGSLVPASGAGGLALGAWILHRGGMSTERIARRSVAFFVVKSSVNFVAVAVIGTMLALGIVGPELSLWLTALPAALSVAVIAAVIAVPRLGPGREPGEDASRARRVVGVARRALIDGSAGAVEIVRNRDVTVLIGAVGYWAWDNAVLWAAFKAVGADVPLTVVLMGYLIGQLGGLLPLPGGVGGIDGGLIGTLVVYGAPAAAAVGAVLAYRLILFWLPLAGGAIAFVSLRRELADPTRPDLCDPLVAA